MCVFRHRNGEVYFFGNLPFTLANKELCIGKLTACHKNLKKKKCGLDIAVRVKAVHLFKMSPLVTGRAQSLPEEADVLKEAIGKSQIVAMC